MAPSLSAVLYGDVVAHLSGSGSLWLPCDPQLLQGHDSQCQNPNPKLLSAHFPPTGLV